MRLHPEPLCIVARVVCPFVGVKQRGTKCTLGKMIYDDDLGYSFKYLIQWRFCARGSSGFTHLFNLMALFDCGAIQRSA